MADFDYGNTRLRAMKSRLIPRRALEGLTEVGSVQGLINALTDTAYRDAVEAALVRAVGMECLAEALRNDLVATVGKARRFFRDQAGDLAALVLRRYDLHNVKTVLRGLVRQVPASEILASTLPIGELRPVDLSELARSQNFRAAIDLLATWAAPLSQPLLELRARRRGEGVEVSELELALDRWHVHTAMQVAREADEEGRTLFEALRLEADVTNIMTALRLGSVADAALTLRERFGADDLTALFVDPGHVRFGLLTEAVRKSSVGEAVSVLVGTPYGPILASAMQGYSATGRLSIFERALARRQLRHAAGLCARDPLGIGVLVGYVALKTNEVANLRAIAQGLMLGEKPERIRAELMFVD